MKKRFSSWDIFQPISENLVESEGSRVKFLSWLNDDPDYLSADQTPLVKKFPQVHGLGPTTTVSPLNFLDWLASKSKLKETIERASSSTTRPSREETPPVKSVDGDVMEFWESSQLQQEDMDTA